MKPKLLILEDDELTLKMYENCLSRKFDVKYCKNSSEFYKEIHENTFDVFLLDIAIKEMTDGLLLTQELRAMQQYKNAAIIVFTAHVMKKDEEASYKAGVTKFLRKPLETKILVKEIYDSLGIKEDLA